MNAPVDIDTLRATHNRHFYVSVRRKYVLALIVALAWTFFSVIVAHAWMRDLSELTHPLFALWALTFIAFVPGFMNAFLAT